MGEPSPLDAKLVLFLYIVTAPALLRGAGVHNDPRRKAIATAAAVVVAATGAAVAAYGWAEPGTRALGYLAALAGLTTVASVRSPGAPPGGPPGGQPLPGASYLLGGGSALSGSPLPGAEAMTDGGDEDGAIEDLDDAVFDAATMDDEGAPSPPRSPEPAGAEALRRGSGLVEGEAAAAGADGAEPSGPGGWRAAPDDVTAEGLERIFSAPAMSEFMNPSGGGFVTPEGLDAVQSNAPGGADMSAAAIAPLGPGSYTAQGVIRDSDISGTVA